MTPDELRALVGESTPRGVERALRGMPEAERKTLSSTAQALMKEARKRTEGSWEPLVPESVALFALGPWSAVRRMTTWDLQTGAGPNFVNLAAPILIDRRPAWAADWIEARLAVEDGRPTFATLESLRAAGVIERPEASDPWAQQFARFLHGCIHKGGSEAVRAGCSDLNGEVLHMLRADSRAWANTGEAMLDLLVELTAVGAVDREASLDESLGAATRGHGQGASAGVLRAHEALTPTAAERCARSPGYLDLLGSPPSAVVAVGLKGTAVTLKAGAVDPDALIDALAPVLELRTKSHPKKALGMLLKAAGKDGTRTLRAAETALGALLHADGDVQARALKAVDRLASAPAPEIAATIARTVPDLVAVLRPDAVALAGRLDPDAAPVEAEPSVEPGALEERFAEASGLPPEIRALAGIGLLQEAYDSGAPVPPLELPPGRVPRLDPSRAIVPIDDLDDLVSELLSGMERLEEPLELERMMDAVSRLCDRGGADQLAPLRQRVGPEPQEVAFGRLTEQVLVVAAALCGLRVGRRDITSLGRKGPALFLERRIDRLAARAERSLALPLLAAPTHAPAWIDPRVFVQRLVQWTHAAEEPDPHDFIQALLRLAPDHRAEALAQLPTDAFGARHVAYALGAEAEGEPEATRSGDLAVTGDGGTEPSGCVAHLASMFGLGWVLESSAVLQRVAPAATHTPFPVAAFRARDPRGDAPPGVVGVGPDGAVAGTVSWHIHANTNRWNQTTLELRTATKPPLPGRCPITLPTVLLHRGTGRTWNWSEGEVGRARVLLGMWPAWPEGLFFRGAGVIVRELDASASSWRSAAGHIEAAVDPDATWTEGAVLIIALAFCSRDADARGIALDAMISAIDDGRCTGEALGRVLLTLHAHGILKLNRLGDALREVARISALHASVVGRLLATFITGLEEVPKRDMHHPLELLLEVLVQAEAPTPPECRPALAQVTGSGKAAKAAKALRARTAPASLPPRQSVFDLALQGRMARARRYEACLAG